MYVHQTLPRDRYDVRATFSFNKVNDTQINSDYVYLYLKFNNPVTDNGINGWEPVSSLQVATTLFVAKCKASELVLGSSINVEYSNTGSAYEEIKTSYITWDPNGGNCK